MPDGGGSVDADHPRRLATPTTVDRAVHDERRLGALRATGLLDTGPEEAFDRLTRLATTLLDAPVSLVSLVDEHRQYFKSAAGLGEPWASRRESPLSHSICKQVVAVDGLVAIDDTRAAEELEGNLAAEEMAAAAYAGAPLRTSSGEVFGAFCVIDERARSWSPDQLALVSQLAEAVSSEVELRDRLGHALRHDRLTGLPNREQFVEHVQERLVAAGRSAVTVTTVDVTRLELVMDSLGEAVANKLLIGVATRLKDCVPGATTGRISEDLFSIVCDVEGEREALEVVDRIRAAVAEPFLVDEHELHVNPNVGLVVGAADDTAEDLVEGSRTALRQARTKPTHLATVGTAALRAEAVQRLRLENGLRRALKRSELHVVYQPKLRLADRSLYGFEALVRWESPDLGFVSPASFIPAAEESGLIGAIGEFVLREAVGQIARWRLRAPELDLSVAVNVSPRQLEAGGLTAVIRHALDAAALPAQALRLEITESALMSQTEERLALLDELSGAGLALELDDFGTGYSSLSHLSAFPLSTLKIDRSFVDGIDAPRTAAVVDAILGMAKALGIFTVAEGIETEAQLARLTSMGCDAGQGYLFSRPAAPDALEPMIDAERERAAAAS